MHRLKVDIPAATGSSYPIVIGSDIFDNITGLITEKDREFAVITDDNVAELYGNDITHRLEKAGVSCTLFSFPAGEKSKTRYTKQYLEDSLLESGFDRSSCVIALGGGVAGDIAGFTAATFMRGISVIQIPTTLLAQVDSSIGGKTAVNHPVGKNLIGAFHQPELVIIDTDTLKTLPLREILNGMAEIIKHGIIRDANLFDILENDMILINETPERYDFVKIIEQSCRIKAAVVTKDEKENGLRRILNYGHTIGHAVETLCTGKVSHGEAVSIGMNAENYIAFKKGLLPEKEMQRIQALLKKSGLPVALPENLNINEVADKTRKDKKKKGGDVLYSLPDSIGRCLHGLKVEHKEVIEALQYIQQ